MGKQMGLKVSEIIRRMIDEGLKKYEKKGEGKPRASNGPLIRREGDLNEINVC